MAFAYMGSVTMGFNYRTHCINYMVDMDLSKKNLTADEKRYDT